MTISSSLNAGVAGLQANATRLASISDNIANSSTYGYKRVETDFHSMVISSHGGTYSAGGVRATTERLIDQRGSLVSTSNASGLVLLGWPAQSDGTIPSFPRDTSDGLQPVQINVNLFSGEPTTSMTLGVNLPATETDAGSPGDTQELSIEYFDNLGTSENVKVEFTPTVPATGSSNEWTMTLRDSVDPATVIGEYTLTFADNRTAGGTLDNVTTVSGGPYDAATGKLIVNVAGGPIEIDIGLIGASDGLTQLSDSFAPVSISKDGSPVGNMTSVEIDANGYVHAFFDTGITSTIYQVPLVDLPNPNGVTSWPTRWRNRPPTWRAN